MANDIITKLNNNNNNPSIRQVCKRKEETDPQRSTLWLLRQELCLLLTLIHINHPCLFIISFYITFFLLHNYYPIFSQLNLTISQLKPITMRFSSILAAASLYTASAFTPTTRSFTRTPAFQMAETALTQDELKKMVGYKSVDDYVKSGMVVGLGTGSTAYFAVERLGQLLKDGTLTDIVAIPTSVRTKEQAEELGIPLVTLDTHSKLDVAIDGADEVDPDLNLVKGGGGALLREKMVEVCADKFIVIGKFVFALFHSIQ